jgi:two-component system KDP operon response regulator KdpE
VAQRHAQPGDEVTVFRTGQLEVDLTAHTINLKGREVRLTATEYSLLRLLIKHAGKVLTHRYILREIWGPNATEQTHYLRIYIAHLRDKLEEAPSTPKLIITESGIGYRLIEDAE